MGKCYIDSINDKFVLNGSNIAFNEFTKYANGKILTLEGVEIIDSTLLSRLAVSGGKLALDGILVNGLDLSNISANILPSADTMYNLGSTTRKYLRGYFGEVNTSTINLDSGSITYDGTNSLLKLGTDTIATREWVNSSAIPTLKTINGEVITGTGDITIVGGSGSSGQTYMDIQYGYMSATITTIAPDVFVPFAQTTNNGTLDYTSKVDNSTILIKAGVLYKFEGQIGGIQDDDASFYYNISFGLYSDIAGTNLIDSVDRSTQYLASGPNLLRAYSATSYIKSDVDCYLKGKVDSGVVADASGVSIQIINTLTKYNTTPIITTGTIELPSYSTTETLTEKRWIDGKPIYRKVFTHTIGATAPTNDIVIYTGLTGIDLSWVDDYKFVQTSPESNVATSSGTFFVADTSEQRVYSTKDGSQISIMIPDNNALWVNSVYYIILEYTKTADTADSPTALIQGTVSNKKYFARISNGTATTLNRTQGTVAIPLNTFVKGDAVLSNGTTGFIAPQDDVYTMTTQFTSTDVLNANITEIAIVMFINGVEDGRASLNPGSTGGYNKGCNGTFIAKLKKNDVIRFKMFVWASDTTSALQIPVNSFIANIRN